MLEKLLRHEHLNENEFLNLCEIVTDILIEESNVVSIPAPVTTAGDLHGQFFDLLELFRQGGMCPETAYVFMGDFVDRGHNSVETIELLLVLKALYPSKMTLLRGNHESRAVSRGYGFYDEILKKYGSSNCWRVTTDLFDLLPIAAVVNKKIFCVHGGLSPEVSHIDHLRLIERRCEIPNSGPFCDIMWSDPDSVETWTVSPRGAGWLFGANVVEDFNHLNGIELICRSHQLAQNGLQYWFNDQLVTVWSAPNYCYRCGNVASILTFDEHLNRSVKTFEDTDESRESCMIPKPDYFL